MPTGRDAALVCETLRNAGVAGEPCADALDLQEKFTAGAGAILIAEEALKNGTLERLVETFDSQPVWSDIPVLIFAANSQNSENLLKLVGARLNATIVERPIRVAMLVSAARGALRARQRQYQTRDLLHQLEESDRQKDLFLATLSHELRTPLNSVLGWIQLLRANGSNGGAVDASHALAVIERNAKAQSEIISDILFVSRVITGKLALDFAPIDLIAVVQSAIDTVRPSIEAKNIQLHLSFDAGAGKVSGDADRLQQVFWNLLSNAVKFTSDGGRIEVFLKNKNSEIAVEICDSWQGIKPEYLPYVFERFRQADSSYTRAVGGLGLGLAIVRHLVELHGGTVGATSAGENCGSKFTVTLPAIAAQNDSQEFSSEPIQEPATEEDSLKDVRLLLVEDDADSLEMLKIMFEQHGFEVFAAVSAREALETLPNAKPHVLISDVGLPGEDGYELIAKVRKLSPAKGGLVPAVALTGYAGLQDRERALDAGFQEHLAKPVDIDELFQLVKNLLAHGSHAAPFNQKN